MKQVIVLEPSDIQRLKVGETLQLTGSLMLSMQVTRKPRKNGTLTEALTKEQRYQREYRQTHPRKQGKKTFPCVKCGKVFSSGNALGPHKRHCPGEKCEA